MKKYLLYQEEIRNFRDVEETIKVVEKEAAAQLSLLKKRAQALRSYRQACTQALWRLSLFYRPQRESGDGARLLLILSGEQGLVGELYRTLAKAVRRRRERYHHFWVVGEKGSEYLRAVGLPAYHIPTPWGEVPTLAEIARLGTTLKRVSRRKHLGRVDLLYPQSLSLTEQSPRWQTFFPVTIPRITRDVPVGGWPLFEPSARLVFERLQKKYQKVILAEAVYETKRAEFTARMITADEAAATTKNLLKGLRLKFFKERRRDITQKQLESFAVHQQEVVSAD